VVKPQERKPLPMRHHAAPAGKKKVAPNSKPSPATPSNGP